MRRTAGLLLLIVVAFAPLAARQRPANPVPTFNRDIGPILQQNCQGCHRRGGIAPFALETYRDAAVRAQRIAFMTASGEMPPWKPSRGCGEFRGERRLSEDLSRMIVTWVNSGSPEGDPRDLTHAPAVPAEWKLGWPDVILFPARLYLPPAHADSFRCFVVPRDETVELAVAAVDFSPLAQEIVHHVLAYVDSTDGARQLDEADPDPGYACMGGPKFTPTAVLGGWFPGAEPFVAPEGVAARVKPGDTVVLQVHYHTDDGIKPDQTQIGFYLSRSLVRQTLEFLAAENVDFVIPAGARDHRVTASIVLPFSIEIHAAGAHMHGLGKTFALEAIQPDGSTRCLLQIDDWDPAWQGMYQYVSPVALPAGTVLRSTATYDNSGGNPRNPNFPPRDVHWGEEAFNEMLSGYVAFTRIAE